MKFLKIFRFEFAYQVRRIWTWLFFAVLLVLSFLMTRDGSLAEVLYADFFINSPFAVAKTTVFGSLIWLVMAAAIAGDAAARDVATGMHPLIYTTPVSKAEYLGGRFLAALVLNALILLSVQAGIMLGVYLPGVQAELIGPFRPAAYLTAYGFIALPNALVATAIQFSLASKSGRAMGAYAGSFLLIFMGFFVASVLLFKRGLGTLLDPIGIRFIVEDISHLWTTVEMSWRFIELTGIVLKNRLLWVGIALVVLTAAYLHFRFAHRTASTWWKRRTRSLSTHAPAAAGTGFMAKVPIPVPRVPRTFGFSFHARQTLAIAWASFRSIATSWAGLAMLIAIPLLTVLVVLDQMVSEGVSLVPTASRIIAELTGPLSDELSRWVIVPFLIVFFAGELIWRERDAGLGEITDAIPGSEWASFLGKFLGLGLVLVVFMAALTLAGMLAQVMEGYHPDSYLDEVGLYLKILFGLQLTDYLLFALLALLVHVVVNQKYAGHLVAMIVYVFIALASLFGIEHNMLVYGAGPGWSYTEMRGFGPQLGPWLWFKLYWTAWALLLAVVARLLWVRGRESGLGVRLRLARLRFTHPTAWIAAAVTGLILAVGAFIFYNTNILNKYLTAADMKHRSAKYERRYALYAGIPQPQLTATSLQIEIYPGRRTADIRGTYHLVNRSTIAIDSILVATEPAVETGAIMFNRAADLVLNDEELVNQLYVLEKPLQPGDSMRLAFEVHVKPHGFRENGVDPSVAANGTFFTNSWLPRIGYQSSRELISASDRREYKLPRKPLIPSLYDTAAPKNRGTGVFFEAVVGTQEDQVAVAPGTLRGTWTASSASSERRRYFHYATDGPIGNEWTFFSANYAMHETSWKNPDSPQTVAIRVFHQPGHTEQLNRIIQGVRASLDYYTKEFGPYRYSYLTLAERPGNGVGMHADPSLIHYSEGFTTWKPKGNSQSLDMPFAVVAHEMGHQWTVPSAFVEGAPVMSESLAWYYGMKVVEKAKGYAHLQRLLNYMRQPHPYPPIRRGEPLLRGLDKYLSYRRGPFALYALSEYIGEEQVNKALRRVLEKHRPQEAPLATTLDLYRELKAVTPDSLQYLLHDLFEVNTYWQLKTERATAKQTKAGTWQVTFNVQAHKIVFNEAGVETAVPMNDWVEIGIFATDAGEASGNPVYLQKHRIRSGKQTITVMVPRNPARVVIDPNHLLVEMEMEDNSSEVKM